MRLISQDGRIDLPYERFIISVNMQKQSEIIAWTDENISDDECIVLAIYSLSEKAFKVMEMLRSAYAGLPVILQNVEYTEDVIEKLKNTNIVCSKIDSQPSKIEYLNNGYFQFPKDEDVEV